MTNRAATVRERFSSAKPDRFLTGAALKKASQTRSKPDNLASHSPISKRARAFFWTSTATANPIFVSKTGRTPRGWTRRTRRPLYGVYGDVMNTEWETKTALPVFAAVMVVGVSVSGCAPKCESTWEPKPRTEWRHIVALPIEPLQDTFRIDAPLPTVGLFPANIAVTRVAVESVDDTGETLPRLFADPRNEFLQWNSTFDDQMAISEVFPIDQRDLGGGPAEPEQIVASFRALHARLGLLYAVNQLSPDESEMFGALYDTSSLQPIASFHAHAASIELPKDAENKADPYHLWKTDSRALVRAKFAKMVYTCVRQLVVNDEPSAVEAPTGWMPAGPIRPVEWPPRRGKRRR